MCGPVLRMITHIWWKKVFIVAAATTCVLCTENRRKLRYINTHNWDPLLLLFTLFFIAGSSSVYMFYRNNNHTLLTLKTRHDTIIQLRITKNNRLFNYRQYSGGGIIFFSENFHVFHMYIIQHQHPSVYTFTRNIWTIIRESFRTTVTAFLVVLLCAHT